MPRFRAPRAKKEDCVGAEEGQPFDQDAIGIPEKRRGADTQLAFGVEDVRPGT